MQDEAYPQRATRTATARKRTALIERDGSACTYCGVPLVNFDTGEGLVVVPWQPCPGGHGDVYPCPDGGHGPFLRAVAGYRFPELDHVLPRSRGGSDSLHNLVLACGPCNGRKGARTPGEWLGLPA